MEPSSYRLTLNAPRLIANVSPTERGMSQIERSFSTLLGLPCWGVSRGFGSFLVLEFGSPHLVVREPMLPKAEASTRVERLLARRSVHVRGRWHLWIHSCEWRVQANEKIVGDWTTPRRIERAARGLNGQKLQDVKVTARGAGTVFAFDLGAELETKPYDRSSEQWLLYEADGRVLTWRADRKYQYGSGGRPPQNRKCERPAG
jgi:hypothetical protein